CPWAGPTTCPDAAARWRRAVCGLPATRSHRPPESARVSSPNQSCKRYARRARGGQAKIYSRQNLGCTCYVTPLSRPRRSKDLNDLVPLQLEQAEPRLSPNCYETCRHLPRDKV